MTHDYEEKDDEDLEIAIREYDPKTDKPYIYSTWTKYAWYSPVEPITVSKHEFFQHKIKVIKEILEKAHVKIACLKSDPYVIYGYVVVHRRKLEWLCIKKDFHGSGIRELLMKSMQGYIYD